MTLDEAIKHCEEKIIELKSNAITYSMYKNMKQEYSDCIECVKDHEQLAEWLKELKARREEDPDPEEAKTYCNHRKCNNTECENNLANAPKGEIVPIVGFTECEQYKKFVAEIDRQARKDLDQAIVDAFDDTEQFRRDAHNLD